MRHLPFGGIRAAPFSLLSAALACELGSKFGGTGTLAVDALERGAVGCDRSCQVLWSRRRRSIVRLGIPVARDSSRMLAPCACAWATRRHAAASCSLDRSSAAAAADMRCAVVGSPGLRRFGDRRFPRSAGGWRIVRHFSANVWTFFMG